jgi:hypothetical protein
MGLIALLPIQRKLCNRFLLYLAKFEHTNLGSSGKHDNHYTTKADEHNPKSHNYV